MTYPPSSLLKVQLFSCYFPSCGSLKRTVDCLHCCICCSSTGKASISFLSYHHTPLFFFFLTSRGNLPCTSQPPRWGEMLLYILTASHSLPVIDYFIPDCDELFFITISKVSNLRWQMCPFVVASKIVAVTPWNLNQHLLKQASNKFSKNPSQGCVPWLPILGLTNLIRNFSLRLT